jgi:hypothetical protein
VDPKGKVYWPLLFRKPDRVGFLLSLGTDGLLKANSHFNFDYASKLVFFVSSLFQEKKNRIKCNL